MSGEHTSHGVGNAKEGIMAATVDADSYAPDMASLVEAGMWREAEVGEWHTPAKEESGIDSYRFRILAKTK